MTFPFPVYRPKAWNVSASTTFNTDIPGWGGYTTRTYWTAGSLLYSATANRVRLRFVPPSAGANLNITAVYFGHAAAAGNAFDFAGDQVQVTFNGGSTTVNVAAGTASFYSDKITYKLDKTKGVVIAIAFAATADARGVATGAGANVGYSYKLGNDAATTVASGYTNATGRANAVDDVEAYV